MKNTITIASIAALLIACSGGAGTNPIDLSGQRDPVSQDREGASSGGDGADDLQQGEGTGSSQGSGSTKRPDDNKSDPQQTDPGKGAELGPKCAEYYNCCITMAGADDKAKEQCEQLKAGATSATEDACDQAHKAAKEQERC